MSLLIVFYFPIVFVLIPPLFKTVDKFNAYENVFRNLIWKFMSYLIDRETE